MYKTLDSTPNTTEMKENEIKMLLNPEEACTTGRGFKMFLLVKAGLFFLSNMMECMELKHSRIFRVHTHCRL